MIVKARPEIERFLKAPGAGVAAALIHGKDRGIVRERADQLAAAVTARPDDPFDVALLTDADLDSDAGRLHGELAAISMMGGRRLVRLRLPEDALAADRLAAEALADHLDGKLNPDAFFLIEAGGLRGDSPVRRLAEKAATAVAIPCYADEAGDLIRLTRQALAEDKVSLTADALEIFVGRLPAERGVARREIERLALFLGPGSHATADAEDLKAFLGVEPEASLAEAAVDAFGGRLGAAHAGLRRAAQEGDSGVPAVRALGYHLMRLRRMAVLTRAGASPREAAKATGVFWKSEAEFLRQSRVWTIAELDTTQPEILAADRACRTAGAPDALIAERLALTVAGKARRLGL